MKAIGRMMAGAGIALALASVAAWPQANRPDPAAETSAALARLDRLMARLAEVKAARAQFVERRFTTMLTEPLVSSGTLLYQAPGRLVKETVAPKPERLVVERGSLTIERGDDRRSIDLAQHPEVAAVVESMRATLAGDLQGLARYYRVEFQGDEQGWHLLLRPSDEKAAKLVRHIDIAGAGLALESIEVVEADGDRSVMTIRQDGR